eukprot:CAMPEP_0168809682 /NCGR_PEP_ID=MMETSP0726-20121227/3213_1 /TAXON_ID=265536 /ORGANISM="Amphiprora sp., Strain CCMP467" /LENGTH=323 /DNA_ID=CAMNT_0008861677 /DNA_START=6 /DNA_END=977 /DNA_ORIENTATION=+
MKIFTLSVLSLCISYAASFSPGNVAVTKPQSRAGWKPCFAHPTADSNDKVGDHVSDSITASGSTRRNFMSVAFSSAGVLVLPSLSLADDRSTKVLVLGGTGLVGSRVVGILNGMGVATVATSRDGRDGTVAVDFAQLSDSDLRSKVAELAKDCTAVISCVGAIGTGNDELVNAGTGIAAVAAKEAGVGQFVYLTVAPEVKEFAKDFDFLKGYIAGKSYSRETVMSTFPKATLIEPTFIYGGDEFKVNPPRVAGFYGEFIEGLLGSAPVRAVEGVMLEGFFKIALEPPVSADAVASAAVAGALGKSPNILDTHDKIKNASKLLL